MSGRLAKRGLVILDRDGVINQDSAEFVKCADEWLALDGSIAAIASLSRSGFSVAVASNQSGLARGLFDVSALSAMHRKMQSLVSAAGGCVEHLVVCPHGPDDDCDCRKPRPGLLHQVAHHFGTDLADVPIVGDSLRDLQAAAAVGGRAILVRTGNGRKTEGVLPAELGNVEVFDDLAAVASKLVTE